MDSSIGVGFRAGVWNDKADEADNASNKIRQYDYMLNYWLSPNAVLKIDYENQKILYQWERNFRYKFGSGIPILKIK